MFRDAATIATTRRTREGFLAVTARVARTGVQVYGGSELGRPEAQVAILRPEAEVFSVDALRSLVGAPVTVGHPNELVDADSWRRYAVGHIGEEIARDGRFVVASFLVTDADAIRQIEAGTRELSLGYDAEIDWTPGEEDGSEYSGRQTAIHINHIAVVPTARGGAELRIA